METSKLKKFAQYARRSLIEQVGSKLAQVLKEESLDRRELPNVVTKLESELKKKGKEQLIEQAAYTWFNRFCALRFMDVNQYNRIMVLSPLDGQFQPEILAEAKAGHVDDGMVNDKAREKIFGLLNGSIKSRDGQSEAYRLLIVAVCNDYHRLMPYLFERIEDYMELLMPDDLLSGNSILAYTREAMTPEACESVECIGWLYQFYISEKKDQVFEGLKKNKKITPENIPAATQLFTPDWIVRYLVENSLGRLWMLNNPNSKVIEQMDYYIKPVEEEIDFLKIRSPEEIKVCDPACGSGHILTYAYDLLYAIYLDAEYDPVDIPELILTKNLYGIEIDERAAELAAFALSMKALKGDPNVEGNNRRRFFRNPIKPNICRLENIAFNDNELNEYIDFIGEDLFTQDLRATLKQFEEADNFGSLIQPTLKNAADVFAILEATDVSGQLFLSETHQRVLQVIDQANYLEQKYHVVIANPPYMGGKGMNECLSVFAKEKYPNTKSDLFAMFIERCQKLTLSLGMTSMITMQSWMFLSSLRKLREQVLRTSYISSMLHLGTRAFDSIGGEVVSTTAFVLINQSNPNSMGRFFRLINGRSESEKQDLFKNALSTGDNAYSASGRIFESIPGSPVGYWASPKIQQIFSKEKSIGDIVKPRQGMSTNDNARFLRYWFEENYLDIGFGCVDSKEAEKSGKKWFPYNKGGAFRKWFGNFDLVVNWLNDGEEIKNWLVNNPKDPNTSHWSRRIINTEFYFQESLTWSDITTASFAARYSPAGSLFDVKGSSAFPSAEVRKPLLALMNSKLMFVFMKLLNPTVTFQVGDLSRVPFCISDENVQEISTNVDELISISKRDWNESELSWDFQKNPLLKCNFDLVEKCYESSLALWRKSVERSKVLEERNNLLLADSYGLTNEIDTSVSENEITLSFNIQNRYPQKEEKELLFKKDILVDFISYAVGCMFGRYSLDKNGLVLVNQGDTLEEYMKQIPQPSFMPDDDNVIPMIAFEGDWFEDDISERFKEFVIVAFGKEHFTENLAFVEAALGKDIKKYFVKDFYVDHVKRYKTRPIYWLFSSPKGTFNALIYVHGYRTDTVSVVLNDYLREFRTKLQARKAIYEQIEISATASPEDKIQAINAILKINKVLDEVNDYERDILYPLAGQKIEIDLDDGVKANYPKFGKALKNITGLS